MLQRKRQRKVMSNVYNLALSYNLKVTVNSLKVGTITRLRTNWVSLQIKIYPYECPYELKSNLRRQPLFLVDKNSTIANCLSHIKDASALWCLFQVSSAINVMCKHVRERLRKVERNTWKYLPGRLCFLTFRCLEIVLIMRISLSDAKTCDF